MGTGFCNNTTLLGLDVPLEDQHARDVVVAIVKATYVIGRNNKLEPAPEPSPIRMNDIPWTPDDPRSSLRYPSDVCFAKVGTDVIVVGDAVSVRPVEFIDVALRVADRSLTIRAHGPRYFYRSLSGVSVGPASETTRVPLRYELAYGGSPDDATVEDRNPSGVGLASKSADLVDTLAPQLEDPTRPHRSARDKHPPVGTGAIMSHWEPRKSLVGTYDEAWVSDRLPLLPKDFDLRYNNVAHPSLRFEEGLVPGTNVAIAGVSLDGPIVLTLPDLKVQVVGIYHEGTRESARPAIDTVLVDMHTRQVELTGRHAFLMGRAARTLQEIRVDWV